MTNQQSSEQTPQAGYVKRALRADGKGGLFVLCGCGEKVSIPIIKGMPMTYECLCGIVYDNRGWIVEKTRRMT